MGKVLVLELMSPVFSLICLIYILDKMAENMNKESEITSTVEDSLFVNIPEVEIKLENAEIQGKLFVKSYTF